MKLFQHFLTPALLAVIAIAQPAFAQQQDEAQQKNTSEQKQQTDNAVPDEMFKKFVEAKKAIQSIFDNMEGPMEEATDEAIEDINKAIVKAIEDSGLSMTDYNSISSIMREDSELQDKVSDEMN